jgi:hypothetical protein
MLAYMARMRKLEEMKARKAGSQTKGTARVKEAAAVYHTVFRQDSPPALQALAKKFGLRQDTLSRLTGFSLRGVAGWTNGKQPSAPVRRAITEMDRLLDALSRLMKAKDVGRWLKEPNTAFDGSSPVQVIERGQIDRVWHMLYFVESGEPG